MDGPTVDLFLWSTESLPRLSAASVLQVAGLVHNTASGLGSQGVSVFSGQCTHKVLGTEQVSGIKVE